MDKENSFIKGSSPKNILTFPISVVDFVKKITITFAQGGEIVIEKTESDCLFEENRVMFDFTQEETLKFDSEKLIEIQVKVLDINDKVFVSRIERKRVLDVINKEIMQ
jgi:hypothetical protein